MIPIRDDNPVKRFPIVTLAIIALNVLAFVVWQPTFGREQQQEIFFFCHAEIPWEISHQTSLAEGGTDAQTALAEQLQESPESAAQDQQLLARTCGHKSWWEAIFVSMFLHGSWLHIGGNMLFLWIFGNNVEDKIGPLVYFAFYILAGIVASLAQLVIDLNSVIPNLGASGAIAGVLGAYIVMFPRRRVLTLVIFFFITFVYLPAYVMIGVWFLLQLFSGVTSLSNRVGAGGGVAFFAHIGGFVFGALMALLLFPKERFGSLPPPRRPDVPRRMGWGGWGRRPTPPDDDLGGTWRGY